MCVCGGILIKRCFFVPNLNMNLLIAQMRSCEGYLQYIGCILSSCHESHKIPMAITPQLKVV